jgi:hypothetical protein
MGIDQVAGEDDTLALPCIWVKQVYLDIGRAENMFSALQANASAQRCRINQGEPVPCRARR